MNWLDACRTLLSADSTPQCPQLSAALAEVAKGEVYAAAEQLEQLDELQRVLATFLVELAAVDAGIEGEALAALCVRLHVLPKNLVELFDLPRSLLIVWGSKVAPRLPAEVVAARDAYGHGPMLLRWGIEHLCEQGRAADALPYAEQIDAYWREERARCWALIGTGLAADHPQREAALGHASAAGNARPMIQDGGEESNAHGIAMELFARGQVAADDPAVARSVAGLLKLGRKRARKDVRSHGAMSAAVAAGLRAADSEDEGWLEHALALRKAIWDDHLVARADAASLLAEQALGRCEGEAFEQRARKLLGDAAPPTAEFVRQLAEDKFRSKPRPEDLGALRRAGVDVSEQITEALAEWDGYGRREIASFVTGCRIGLDDAELDELLAKVREDERAEAMVKGARYGFTGDDARKARYLEQGYPQGDRFGIYSEGMLHLLSPAKRLEGEDHFARSGDSGALAQLCAEAMQRGDIEGATRAIAKLSLPETDGEWVPFYRRGNRSFELPTPAPPVEPQTLDAAGIKAALKQLDGGIAMLKLARSVAHDADALARVVKAAKLKKWSKKANAPSVARVRLLGGELASALELVESLGQGRVENSQLAHGLRGFVRELELRGEAIEHATATRLIALTERAHPQYVTGVFIDLARISLRHGAQADREGLIAALRSASSGRYRCQGDRAFVEIGIARGLAALGEDSAARGAARRAVGYASKQAIYFKGPSLVRGLASIREQLGSEFVPLALDALRACTVHEGRHYAQVMQVERSFRYLWDAGDAGTTLAWLAADDIPKIIARDLQRSIWADIEHVPEALRVLEAAWPSEPASPEIAAECIRAAVTALRAAGQAEAEAVAGLLG